ncbi:hypothetical protein RvY_16717 [Ramazzottius varieornatus]|uniref:Uncharacterized protein n=1 Tax=Ramazzottius varieornatus TaxID=947166 RepID=A0A1D1VZH4_RAMVA|nr:hypothetical protein RvY_16717 [Ramazzottius varieornatus]
MDRVGTGALQEASIDCVVRQLQHHHTAQSTRATCNAGSRRFLQFCFSNNEHPHRTLHAESHPIRSHPKPSEAIQSVLNGYKRMTFRKDDQRLPDTLSLMRHRKDKMAATDLSDQDKTMYWSACTISFFGALRIGVTSDPNPI